ncbi:Dityrosine transporter 1, partial [Tieghemiomyces parasiticus]
MVRPPDKLPGKSSRELYIVPSQATTATYLPSLKTAGGSASPNPSPTVSTTTLTPADSSDLPYVPFSDNHKRLMVAIVAFTGMVAPFSSEVFLPALTDMVTDFGTSVTMINGAVAVFMMALAIAPLFWGVLADNYGRRPAYAAGTLLCTAASTGCALAVNPAMLIVMRFLQAVGGSVLVAGGAGTISDIYEPARRGSALGLYFGGQMVGPILGTILGGYVGQAHGWRWTFWMTAILSGISWFLLTVVLPETHRVLVVQRHQVDLRGLTQDDVQSRPPVNWRAAFNPRTVFRPLHLPYVAIPVLIMTVIMASYYAMLTVTSTIFKLDYGYSTATVGLYFLAPGVGNVIGAVGCGWLSDRTMKWCLQRRQAKRIDAVTAADAIDYLAAVEGRLPPLLVAMVIYPVCYLIFAWLVQFHAPIATALSMQFI